MFSSSCLTGRLCIYRSIGLCFDDDANEFIFRLTRVSARHGFVVLLGTLTTEMRRELAVFQNKNNSRRYFLLLYSYI